MKQEGGLRSCGVVKKTESDLPLISVVTVVYNCASHIEQTIQSVIGQDYKNIEYVVIDGGSTDGTVDILRRYNDHIDYWVSEPDNGISDAFNKGIALCLGEVIGTLNADDTYTPGAIRSVVDALTNGHAGKILHGAIIGVWGDHSSVLLPRPLPGLFMYVDVPYYHPSSFVPRVVYERIGGYDPAFHYAMDYDFFLRATKNGVEFHRLPEAITRYSFGGKSGSNPLEAHREVFRSQRRQGLFYPICLVTYWLKMTVNKAKKYLS